MGKPEEYRLIPVIDGETREDLAETIEVAEPEDGDPDLAEVMREVAEMADMGILEFLGDPNDPDTRVNMTGKGWALLEAYDRGDTEAEAAIMRGDIVLFPS